MGTPEDTPFGGRSSSTPAGTPQPVDTSPLVGRTDPDVEGGLAVQATTRTLAAMAASVVGLGLVAAGAASMARVEDGGMGADMVTPGLVVLMVGMLAALVGAVLAAWVLLRLLRHDVPVPGHAVAGLSRALGLCARGLVAALVLTVGVWVVVRPSATLSAVLGGLVAVQVAVVIGAVRARVLRPR
ncbi:hypothetical protein FH969_14445 [Miniimonas arenae]|uniref:DUF2975 domain-containing protein n=1 Tax=Miniimonas arenae TaxID=676201 RepID=A0A5C5B7B5_9MICO|nr:hypothetical protein [Miniimonas arenae]TNU72863.1 hypothetical protein FH969_14445 [Miniimonas arenae]